jgi:hypothetical protein
MHYPGVVVFIKQFAGCAKIGDAELSGSQTNRGKKYSKKRNCCVLTMGQSDKAEQRVKFAWQMAPLQNY